MSAIGALGAVSASAQTMTHSIVRLNSDNSALSNFAPVSSVLGNMELSREFSKGESKGTTFGKTTASGSRWYNYVNHLGKIDGTILSDEPVSGSTTSRYGYLPIWKTPNMNFKTSTGTVDTINLMSYGAVFDPTFPAFNVEGAAPASDIAITKTNAYTLDSVSIWGIYFREPTKPTVVDTLRIAVVSGRDNTATTSNLPSKNYYMNGTGQFGTSPSGATITRGYFPALFHDTVANRATGLSGRPAVQIFDILLTEEANANDTGKIQINETTVGVLTWNKFSKKIAMNILPNDMVGISATFITGDPAFTAFDTLNLMDATAPKFNHFLPLIFEQTTDKYPTYYGYGAYADTNEAHYNIGYLKPYPYNNSWETNYIPAYAYAADFGLELPYIDYKISCTSCKTVGEITAIKESNLISIVNAFPNPANSTLNVPFTIAEKATVTVRISNMVGQVIATHDMGTVNAGQQGNATFNTSNLANGVYMYTVEANGQRVSNRFSVAH
ncbi:MAG TPA: T9SS type A sorting domain-containing protein [Chitinophagaceae bacterium]|nr:T9SS type A sorting domain-containing protein [Chitinophagaceae bacterium]